MGVASATRIGFLTDDPERRTKVAIIDSARRRWTYAEILQAFGSIPTKDLSGCVAVLVEDPLLSGIVSCAVMEHCTCVPLDPNLAPSELEARIKLLGIRSIISDRKHYLDIKNLSWVTVKLEERTLTWQGEFSPGRASSAALVLMTSGSTGVPKLVNLSHENLIHSIGSIIESIGLTELDRAINLLPMSHIGGLVDLFLAPLISGGSIVFSEDKNPDAILSLLAEEKVTWLQGAPAILQNLLRVKKTQLKTNLRIIRSVSAPLSHQLFEQLTKTFGVPVIEIYGMSETAGVITSNPLPPAEQKLGSVGKAVNCEVTIRNDNEVWVSSNSLFSGYPNDEDNQGLWDGRAFFTGDLGYLDQDDYLFLTGRAKERINRGGQKIDPREIDQTVESWDEVREAASFGFPHPTLGQEVGLAIVLEAGTNLSDEKIRERLTKLIANYKLPKRLIRLEKLPRNQGGKLQRHLLSEIPQSKIPSSSSHQSTTERRLIPLWCNALSLDDTSNDADFFEQGGDSLSATSFLLAVEKEFKISLIDFIFYENATIQGVARAVEGQLTSSHRKLDRKPDFPPRIQRKLLRFLSSWPGTPPFEGSYARVDPEADSSLPILFWCSNSYKECDLVSTNAKDIVQLVSLRTLHHIQHKKLRNYRRVAQIYADELERIQPEGSFNLGGFCEGSRLMVNTARVLIARGREIRLLFLYDHILEEPFPAHVAMIYSTGWKNYPLDLYASIEQRWRKIFQNRFGLLTKQGRHSGGLSEEFQKKFRSFLAEQLDYSNLPILDNAPQPPPSRQDLSYSLKLCSKLPKLIKTNQIYPVSVLIKNENETPLPANMGFVLHARWVDIHGERKPSPPMFTELPHDLPPGQTIELEIAIIAAKKNRFYQIQIALIEEGWEWPKRKLAQAHHQWFFTR